MPDDYPSRARGWVLRCRAVHLENCWNRRRGTTTLGPPDVQLQMSLKQSRWCIPATAERYGPSGPCSVDRTERLRESFGHSQEAHKEISSSHTPVGTCSTLVDRGGTTWHPARLIARCHSTFGRLLLALTQC